MSNKDFWDSLIDVIVTGLEASYEKSSKEEKADIEQKIEHISNAKAKYTKGTVVDAMAERGWDRFDMRRVLQEVTDSEKAEAAVGLIKSGKYTSFDVLRILEDF